ncbi:MAG: hypothetical protein IKJ09_08545 [Bacteroidaceae bacterium]|nr:hypothetical protein [Bacteroidaceae bacterium]
MKRGRYMHVPNPVHACDGFAACMTFNSQFRSAARAESSLLELAKCWAGLELCRRRERVSVLGQAKRKHCDEGSFNFPEELQLVALLQGILMQSIIIHDFSMKWAFSEDSHQFTEKKSFIFGLARSSGAAVDGDG